MPTAIIVVAAIAVVGNISGVVVKMRRRNRA